MFTKTNRSRRMTTAVAIIVGLLFVAAPTFALSPTVTIVRTSVSGSAVQVTVKNTSAASASRTVAVQAVVGDTAIWSFVPVILLSGQTACVSAAFTAPVKSVLSVSVQDDGSPF